MVLQALSMGCFPNLKVKHTSTKHEGQIYIKVVNYMFVGACIAVTGIFRTSEKLSNAYGNSLSLSHTHTTTFISHMYDLILTKCYV
jgi:KUP system potassium uptake protein